MRPGVRALAAGAVVLVAAAAVVAPWAIRNRVQVGCFAITTDARALWKANNEHTYDVLARGGWIDDVPELPGVPPWPERAAELGPEAARAVDECAQMRFYREQVTDFWREHPGEKARLAAQAVGMLWRPTITTRDGRDVGRRRGDVRAQGGRAAVHDPALRARALGPLPRAAPVRWRWRCCCSRTTR